MMNKMNKKEIFGKSNYNEDVVRTVKILLVVILLLGIVYFATALATGEIKLGGNKTTSEEKEATIQYEEILAGESLNRKDEEYFVLYVNYTDDYSSTIISVKDSYEKKDKSLKFYLVDLDKGFNTSLIASSDEKITDKPKTISDLKVSEGMTLLRVKNGKVTKRVTGYETIKEYINKLEA